MTQTQRNQQAYALLSAYEKFYKLKYGKSPNLNRYREKWGALDVIDGIGYDRAVEVLQFYFSTSRPGHPVNTFFFNYDRLGQALEELKKDKVKKQELMRLTQKRVQEWEERHEHRGESN